MVENAARFSGRVEQYERYRERYDPDIVLPLLREWCGLTPEWTVADVGAGTGMLADVFLANGNPVIAVEPNLQMREACARNHAESPALRVVDGTAETTGLEDASVDMVSVGRALHWFDGDKAFAEFRRILKPGGWVAIIAFGRADVGSEENVVLEQTLEHFMPERHRKKGYEVYGRVGEAFASGEFHHAEVHGEMRLTFDELMGLAISLSHAPLPGSERYPAFETALQGVFQRFAGNGLITIQTRYWINAGRW